MEPEIGRGDSRWDGIEGSEYEVREGEGIELF